MWFGKLVSGITMLALLLASLFVVPRLFGVEPYIVISGSMEPAVHTGAVAFVNTRDRECQVGDIITYRLNGGDGAPVVTHRVVGVENGSYITRGDANEVPDLAPVEPSQVLGTFLFQIPWIGYLVASWRPWMAVPASLWLIFLNGTAMALEAASSGDGASDKKKKGKESEMEAADVSRKNI